MAAGDFTLYFSSELDILNGGIALGTDNLVMALLSSAYTPAATHATWADVSAYVITDSGYAEQTVGSVALTQASGTVTVDSADVSFGTNVSLTAKYAVIRKGTTGAPVSTDKLLGYVDLNTGGGTVSSTNSVFSVNTPSGLFIAT